MSTPPEWLIEVLKQSPTLTVCLVVVWFAINHIIKEHAKHLASKDAEIERLVAEKNKLQEFVLEKRLSTEEKQATPTEEPTETESKPKKDRKHK